MHSIATFVKQRRKLAGLTQEEFSVRAGVALTVIRKIEQGKINLSADKLNTVLKMFGHEIGPIPMKRTTKLWERLPFIIIRLLRVHWLRQQMVSIFFSMIQATYNRILLNFWPSPCRLGKCLIDQNECSHFLMDWYPKAGCLKLQLPTGESMPMIEWACFWLVVPIALVRYQ